MQDAGCAMQDAGCAMRDARCMISRRNVVIAFVAPDKGFIGDRQRFNDRMFCRFGMFGVVGLLRLAASDMATGDANPEIKIRSALFTFLCGGGSFFDSGDMRAVLFLFHLVPLSVLLYNNRETLDRRSNEVVCARVKLHEAHQRVDYSAEV